MYKMFPETSKVSLAVKSDSIHLTGISQKTLDEIDKFPHKSWHLVRSDTGFILRNAEVVELDTEAKENSVPSKPSKGEESAAADPPEGSLDDDVPAAQFSQIMCSSPRGRYDLMFGQKKLIFKGKTNSFAIEFNQIGSFFVVSPTSAAHTQVLVFPRDPIKVGKTALSSIVWEISNKYKIEVTFKNASTDEDEVLNGVASDVFSKVVDKFPEVKVQKPLFIHRTNQISGVSCTHKFNSGNLFVTSKGLLFGPKPAIFMPFEKVKDMNFPRIDELSKTFDFELKHVDGSKFNFDNLDKESGKTFVNFVKTMEKTDEASSSTKTEKRVIESTGTRRSKRAAAVQYYSGENLDSDSDDDDYNMQNDPLSKKLRVAKSDSDGDQDNEDSDTSAAVNMDTSQLPSLAGTEEEDMSDADDSDEQTSEDSDGDGGSEDSESDGEEVE